MLFTAFFPLRYSSAFVLFYKTKFGYGSKCSTKIWIIEVPLWTNSTFLPPSLPGKCWFHLPGPPPLPFSQPSPNGKIGQPTNEILRLVPELLSSRFELLGTPESTAKQIALLLCCFAALLLCSLNKFQLPSCRLSPPVPS